MNFDTTLRTILATLEMLYNTTFTKCVKAFCDCCGINEVSSTHGTHDMGVYQLYLYLQIIEWTK